MANNVSIETLNIRIKATDEATGVLNKIENRLKGFGGSTKGLNTKTANTVLGFTKMTLILRPLARAMSKCISVSSEYTEILNKVGIAFGNAQERVVDYAESVSGLLGIDSGEFLDYESTFGSLLKGMKVTDDLSVKMSQHLTELAYDYASLFDEDVSKSYKKLSSAMSGQIKGLKEYGNNVSVAMVNQTLQKHGIDATVSSLDSASQAYARYITIMENAKTLGVEGDMARTINSISNQYRIFKAEVVQLTRALGHMINSIAKYVLPVLNKMLALIINIITALTGYNPKEALEDIDYGSIGGVADGIDDVTDAIDGSSNSADKAKKAVEEYKKALQGFDELNIIPAPNKDTSSSSGSKGSGGGIKDLSGYDWASIIDDIEYDFTKGLENSLAEWVEDAKQKVRTIFDPLITAWEDKKALISTSWEFMLKQLQNSTATIATSFNDVWQNGTGYTTVATILDIINAIMTSVGFLSLRWNEAWTEGNKGTNIIQNLWNAFNSLLGIVDDFAISFALMAYELDFNPLIGSFEKLSGAISDVTSNVREGLNWVVNNVILPLSKMTIETALPLGLNMIAEALERIGGASGFERLATFIEGVAAWELFSSVLKALSVALSDFLFLFEGLSASESLAMLGIIFSDLWASVTGLGTAFTAFLASLEGMTFVEGMIAIFTGLGEAITSIFTPLQLAAIGVIAFCESIIETYQESESFRDTVSLAFENVKSVVDSIVNGFLIPAINVLIGVIMSIWHGGLAPLWDQLKLFIGQVFQLVLEVWNFISPVFSLIIDVCGSVLVGIFTGLGTVFSSMVNLILGAITLLVGAFNGMLGVINPVIHTLIEAWDGFVNGFINSWNKNIRPIINSMLGGFETMANGFIDVWNRMINGINNLKFNVPDWIPIIGGKHFGLDLRTTQRITIPRLATGGFVKPDKGQLINVNEKGHELVGNFGGGTLVSNNEQVMDMITKSLAEGISQAVVEINNSSSGGQFTINIPIDGKVVAKKVFEVHNGIVKQTGLSPLNI